MFGNRMSTEEIPDIAWEDRIIDKSNIDSSVCLICCEVLKKPLQCLNGHIFCESCIKSHLQRHNAKCPQCRCDISENQLARCLYAENHINSMKVHCKFYFQYSEEKKEWVHDVDDGCPHVGEYEHIEKHEKDCEYSFVSCRYNMLCGKIRKKNIQAHEKECPFKPLQCPHCGVPLERHSMQEHIDQCDDVMIPCPDCKSELRRGDMEAHKKNYCPDAIIPCVYAEFGCNEKIPRKNSIVHLDESPGEHLLNMKKAFQDTLVALKRVYDTQLQKRDDRIKELERIISSEGTTIEWDIHHWSVARRKKYLESNVFEAFGVSWKLGLFTKGFDFTCADYISIYLFLDRTSLCAIRNISIEFTLKILNKDHKKTAKKDFPAILFPVTGGEGWGERKFVLSSQLCTEEGFVQNDCLQVRAHLMKRKDVWHVQRIYTAMYIMK